MELMVGKLLPYFVIGLIDAAFCLLIAVFWFEVPFRGSLWTLFLTTSLFLVVVLGLGYFISASIRSQVGASQIALVATLLPTTLLSGFAFPIEQMPSADPVAHLSGPGALLLLDPEIGVPQGQRARRPARRRSGCSRSTRRWSGSSPRAPSAKRLD